MTPPAPGRRIRNPLPDCQSERCGHNYEPMNCPYEFCGYRDTLIALQGLLDAITDAAVKGNRYRYPGKTAKFALDSEG